MYQKRGYRGKRMKNDSTPGVGKLKKEEA